MHPSWAGNGDRMVHCRHGCVLRALRSSGRGHRQTEIKYLCTCYKLYKGEAEGENGRGKECEKGGRREGQGRKGRDGEGREEGKKEEEGRKNGFSNFPAFLNPLNPL